LSSKGYIKGRDNKRGAVYDPVSGLVIVAHHSDTSEADGISLSSYDVDTDTWTALGATDVHPWSFLVGYSSETDELIFTGGWTGPAGSETPITALVDPRTGITTVLDTPTPDIFAPWGAWYPYAVGVDGAVLFDPIDGVPADDDDVPFGDGNVCRFDTRVRTWDECPIDSADGPRRSLENAAKVYDPINERLVFVLTSGDVWAVDLDTGEWTELH
jgi:hypothetical protein